MKPAGEKSFPEIAKGLRCIAGAMNQEHRRLLGPREHEPFATRDDAIRPQSSVLRRQSLHGSKVTRA
jgi:hypothetical protein